MRKFNPSFERILNANTVSSIYSKYSDTQCVDQNLLYYFANPNSQCAPLWPVVSDYYAYPYVCSYSEANCAGSCDNYYLNATCTRTGSGDNTKGARSSSYKVYYISVSY